MFGRRRPLNSLEFIESNRLGLAYSRAYCHQKFVENRFHNALDLFRFDLIGHYSCVNALDVSKDQAFLASGGDCMRVLIWDLDRAFCSHNYQPAEMKTKHESNIFAVAFTPDKRTLFSGGNDGMIIAHDPQTGEVIRSCELSWQVISSISVNPHQPNLCMVATCDSFINGITGQSRGNGVYQLDLRTPWRLQNMAPPEIAVVGAPHCVQHNPVRSNCIATADSKHGLLQWDLRDLSVYEMRYEYEGPSDQGLMSLSWSSDGNRIASLPKRDTPRLYATDIAPPIATFSAKGFENGCTLKSVTFAGPKEEYVVTGSDSFQVYLWRHDSVPCPTSMPFEVTNIKDASLTLTGHRSIVNQVRYCSRHYCLFSSGVEKMIKTWSIFPSPRSQGSLSGRDRAPQRKRREHSRSGSLPVFGQIANDSVEEDPMMLTFFDRLLNEDDTTDSSGQETDLDGGFSEMLRRRMSPHMRPDVNDSGDEESIEEKCDYDESRSRSDEDQSISSDDDASSSTSSRQPKKRLRFMSGGDESPKRKRRKNSRQKPRRSCASTSIIEVSDNNDEQPMTSRPSFRQSCSNSSFDSDTTSTVHSNDDTISSLSSLSSHSSSSSSECNDQSEKLKKTSSTSQNVSKLLYEPPKNLRPSFNVDESEEMSDSN